jgi:uncharacterized protein YacL
VIVILLLIDVRLAMRNKQPKQVGKSRVVLDTSSLIDGRITDVAATGFLPFNIIVPSVVLRELQLLADGRDSHKRERARAGLDSVAELQRASAGMVTVHDETFPDLSTDDALIILSKKLQAYLCTTDFNLNKVAVAEGIQVLNVNELAQMLRPKVLPGEIIEVKIIQKGELPTQGVGYLDDGTMIVVDGAIKLRGKLVRVDVDRMIQTKAGKMIFGKLRK